MKKNLFKKSGFTLIELLVVIGILAILLSIVLIAINPARQFAQANNTRRRSDTVAILNSVSQYAADHKGLLPTALETLHTNNDTAAHEIADPTTAPTGADICSDVIITTQYLPALPSDPQAANGGAQITTCTTYDTGYKIAVDANKRVTVSAPLTQIPPELAIISVTR